MKAEKQFDLATFMRRTLWVTLIVAMIEIPLIYMYATSNSGSQPNHTIAATPAVSTEEPLAEKVIESQPAQSFAPDSIRIKQSMKPPVVTPAPTVAAVVKDTVKPQPLPEKQLQVEEKPKLSEEKKIEPSVASVELTNDNLEDVMAKINAAQVRLNKSIKCVKIRKTSSSNVSNAFKIADYLKSKGFVMAGREEVSKYQQGLVVDAAGDCFVITIGRF